MLLAIGIIAILTLLSPSGLTKEHLFARTFYTSSLSKINSINIRQSLRSICPSSGKAIYFETEVPGKIFKTNAFLQEATWLNLGLKSNDTIASLFETYIDSPKIYIAAGNVPAILQFSTDPRASRYEHLLKTTFSHATMTGKINYVLRAYKHISSGWEQIFVKENLEDKTRTEERFALEQSGDAGFSTDGLLRYDDTSHRILFLFHYRSSFICMDTTLNLIYRAPTIDSNTTTVVTTGTLSNGNESIITNTSPLRDINLQCCVNNGLLFNVSKEKASNESSYKFKHNTVVDVYNVYKGSYKGSFYIPFYEGEKMIDLKVTFPHLIVLYKTHIVLYQLPSDIQNPFHQ